MTTETTVRPYSTIRAEVIKLDDELYGERVLRINHLRALRKELHAHPEHTNEETEL